MRLNYGSSREEHAMPTLFNVVSIEGGKLEGHAQQRSSLLPYTPTSREANWTLDGHAPPTCLLPWILFFFVHTAKEGEGART